MSKLLDYLQENQENILFDLETLVRAESPSQDKQAVDRCGHVLQQLFRTHLGVQADVFPQEKTGDHLRFALGVGEEQILIITHFDTVWDIGRLTYRVEENKAYGPGIFDMKGGIIQSLWALKACVDLHVPLQYKIVFLCTSDEEIGSASSRQLIEEEARKSRYVLVPEPAVADSGALKTARKGVGEFRLKIKGKATHSGNHHEEGVSAVEELARQIMYIHSLTDYSLGTTLNVGIARGGTRVNVVPDEAEAVIDLRVTSMAEAERITHLLHNLKPQVPGTSITVEGDLERPPMERTEKTVELFNLAKECGEDLGIPLTEAFVGGGSDGNFTAALGVPTLDGLGPMGDGPHAEYEHVLIDQLPLRSALFAHLLMRLQK
ncbi:M20 family metallopeptidase [Ammoniphilus sp. CFH 90114]|uniref:M20 family metallopeptidase n=1 Tax=Ammoniphilus sp. CFH 90114 TaxID=2493665 RepID=UPI001F0C8AE5|nr:M20 family metallopeptidase [Ammoniphilus sp. CFH 90114]